MLVDEPVDTLLENLATEDKYFSFQKKKNNFYFFLFNNIKYFLIIEDIENEKIRLNKYKQQIFEEFSKYNDKNYVFAIFGYDFLSKTVVHVPSENILFDIDQNKDLSITIKENEIDSRGVFFYYKNNITKNIQFHKSHFSFFITQSKKQKIDIDKQSYNYIGFDYLYDDFNFEVIENKISSIHMGNYVDLNKKIYKWDREEFILVFDLYLKIKKGLAKDSLSDEEVLKVKKIFFKKSKIEKKMPRTLNSILLRISNFKSVDPQYKGKGLEGGVKLCKPIYNEFINNESALAVEINKIYEKYLISFSESTMRKYSIQNVETVSKVKITNLDFDEIQNLKDRASSLHKHTLNTLYSYLKNKGFIPYEDPKTFDMFAYNKTNAYLYEAKTLTHKNFVSQIRSAILQIKYYEFFHKDIKTDGFNLNLFCFIIFHDNPKKYIDLKTLELYSRFMATLNLKIMYIEEGEIQYEKISH